MKTNTMSVKYIKRGKLPKGCPPFDVIMVQMRNFGPDGLEFYMTPDEALFLATKLSAATFIALEDDRDFHKRFISARVKWANRHLKTGPSSDDFRLQP